jgi:hypothetical protein
MEIDIEICFLIQPDCFRIIKRINEYIIVMQYLYMTVIHVHVHFDIYINWIADMS